MLHASLDHICSEGRCKLFPDYFPRKIQMPEKNKYRELAELQLQWVSARLKQLRYLRALSLAEAGELVGMQGTVIGRVERGKISNSMANIATIVSAYGVSLSDFFALCPGEVITAHTASKAKGTRAKRDSTVYDPDAIEADRFEKYLCSKYPHLSGTMMEAYRDRQAERKEINRVLSEIRDKRAANKAKKKKP
jgi:transcriptional regulator with XRE-family HTH domain